ncbi:MAG: DUF2071 domain-containing protein [Flavobacteriales bacterium]|nr:DUF2071 domain-containing protein [Flavobacteriales bacterium]
MFEALQHHPFGVRATLDRTVVLAYAAPREKLKALIPSFLELDTYRDELGFVAMAIVRTRQLRPAGFPVWLGQDFWLIGYRIFVRYRNAQGRRLRGLYILGSETDRRRMAVLGDLFTHYRYAYKRLKVEVSVNNFSLDAADGSTYVHVDLRPAGIAQLPESSVFTDWSEARRFVGPLPFTFSHDERHDSVLIVEGSRENWTPTPVTVNTHHSSFISQLPLSTVRLSNAFSIEQVPYFWKPGVLEPLKR